MTEPPDPDPMLDATLVRAVDRADDPPATADLVAHPDVERYGATEREVHYALLDLLSDGILAPADTGDAAGLWVLAEDDRAADAGGASEYETERVFPTASLPSEEATGVVWLANYREGIDVLATRVSTTARDAARRALDVARYEPAPDDVQWELRGADTYTVANRGELGWERREASVGVSRHTLYRPDD